MIKILLVPILFLISNLALAEVRLDLVFPETEIKQGSLHKATLEIDTSSLQNFEIQKLRAQSPNDVLYFYNLSPLMKNGTNEKYTSEVSVVFLKVPETNSLKFTVGDKEVYLSWNSINVIPTEASKGMIFEAFDIPQRKKILFWALCFLALLVVAIGGYITRKRLTASRNKKRHRQQLKQAILSAQTYEEVISVWQRKFHFQTEFPHTADAFKNLEKTLFKYVFKPHQSETEKTEILRSYRSFVSEIQGGFNGI